jgi:hypothetical protein
MPEQEFSYETWVETQGEEVRKGIETYHEQKAQGLLNTVKATREERDVLSKELKELSKKVTQDSEVGKQLGELTSRLEFSEKKSNFLEQAAKVGCKKPTVAFALANAENLYLEDGTADWEKIREAVPELFTIQSIKSDAGSGTNQKPEANLNANIRNYLRKKHKR